MLESICVFCVQLLGPVFTGGHVFLIVDDLQKACVFVVVFLFDLNVIARHMNSEDEDADSTKLDKWLTF